MRLQNTVPLQFPGTDGISETQIYIDALATSAGFTSVPIFVGRARSIAVIGSTTGSLAGTVKIQGCIDPSRFGEVPGAGLSVFYDLNTAQTLDSSHIAQYRDGQNCDRWVRAVVTVASGSGNLTIRCQYKGVS